MTSVGDEQVTTRAMRDADLAFGMRLVELAGWNQTTADWRFFLTNRPKGCFVSEWEGVPAGTVTTTVYGDSLGWVSMVLVDPKRRRRGIGTALVRHAVRSLSGVCTTIKLDATPVGQEVYTALGFEVEARFERRVRATAPPPDRVKIRCEGTIRQATLKDLDAIVGLDRRALGAERRTLMEALLRRAPERTFVLENESGLCGFCGARDGSRYTHIGPVVGDDAGARTLLLAALSVQSPQPLVIDTVAERIDWLTFLEDLGFERERPLVRMRHGPRLRPEDPRSLCAAAGPELG